MCGQRRKTLRPCLLNHPLSSFLAVVLLCVAVLVCAFSVSAVESAGHSVCWRGVSVGIRVEWMLEDVAGKVRVARID